MPFIKNRIFLDSGHSLSDPGTTHEERVESRITMRIRDILIPLLEFNHFNVEKVPDNLNLGESIAWINERAEKPEDGFALAIHINFGGGEGAETWYYKDNDRSRILAQDIVDIYCKETGMRNRGAKSSSTSRFGTLGFIDYTDCWAVIIECGFIESGNDMRILSDYEKNARAIAKAVCSVFEMPYLEKQLTMGESIQVRIFAIMRRIEELMYQLRLKGRSG